MIGKFKPFASGVTPDSERPAWAKKQPVNNSLAVMWNDERKILNGGPGSGRHSTLSKGHHVYWREGTDSFAKDYINGKRGDHRSGVVLPKDESGAENFHSKYTRLGGRSGFAGSGEDIYNENSSGKKYYISRSANGKGFSGTDYSISEASPEHLKKFNIM